MNRCFREFLVKSLSMHYLYLSIFFIDVYSIVVSYNFVLITVRVLSGKERWKKEVSFLFS